MPLLKLSSLVRAFFLHTSGVIMSNDERLQLQWHSNYEINKVNELKSEINTCCLKDSSQKDDDKYLNPFIWYT